MTPPAHYRLAFSTEAISARVLELGAEIGPWAGDVLRRSNEQVLAICVLRGGIYFFADLLRAIPVSIEPFFCRTWSYRSTDNVQDSGHVRVSFEDIMVKGRSLLLIDDICDTGSTLRKLSNVFRELGADEVRTAVLVHRAATEAEAAVVRPNWSAFQYQGPEWFVGYGMEDRNSYTNLPAVYVIGG